MITYAAHKNAWDNLDWLIEDKGDKFKAAPPHPVRTFRQNFRLIDGAGPTEIGMPQMVPFAYFVVDIGGPDRSPEVSRVSEWCTHIKQWDIFDIATIFGIVLVCLGFVMALFSPLKAGGILFPIGAVLMAFAAYGADRRDVHAD